MLAEELGIPFVDMEPACANCRKREPENATREQKLLKCSRCRDTLYCSRECQVTDWKRGHKMKCALIESASNAFLEAEKEEEAGTHSSYLDCFSEEDAMDRLIDAYRLRVEDEYVYLGENRGLYALDDPFPDFCDFLNLAESKKGVLPKWWNRSKRMICHTRALNEDNWCYIRFAVEKSDVQEHYKDSMIPMMLRMLAEQVYGRGVR